MNINNRIEFFKTIDKRMLLELEVINLPMIGLFPYPNWLIKLISKYLAYKVNKKYKRIQKEINKMIEIQKIL